MIENFTRKEQLNDILKATAKFLDISQTQYEDAVNKYNAVAKYLEGDDKILSLHPEIYPQGSFNLGTVIKPISDKDEFDIDLVCELKLGNKSSLTQNQLKNLIGDRLKFGRYKEMLKSPEGRRCWTIEYAEETRFHMDLLPAIPDDSSRLLFESLSNSYGSSSIGITDKEHNEFYVYTDDWVKSNPKGYLQWFKEQMLVMLNESKRTFAATIQAKVDDVPDYKVKTPLQRAIQILKRHKDMNCEDNDDKPISIIITTLSAKAYNNESDIYDALKNILSKMSDHIRYEYKNGKRIALIENPVDNRENFADKWEEYPEREKLFHNWLEKAKRDFNGINDDSKDLIWINESMGSFLGEASMRNVFSGLGTDTRASRENGALKMAAGTGFISPYISSGKTIKPHNFYASE